MCRLRSSDNARFVDQRSHKSAGQMSLSNRTRLSTSTQQGHLKATTYKSTNLASCLHVLVLVGKHEAPAESFTVPLTCAKQVMRQPHGIE